MRIFNKNLMRYLANLMIPSDEIFPKNKSKVLKCCDTCDITRPGYRLKLHNKR